MFGKVIRQEHQWLYTDAFKPIDVTTNLVLWAGDNHPDMINHPLINFANNCSWNRSTGEDRGYPVYGF
jgi:hypothetical protein